MGSHDLYLIKKLKESGISIDKLNNYLRKLFLATKEVRENFRESTYSQQQIVKPIFHVSREESKLTQNSNRPLNENMGIGEYDETNKEFEEFLNDEGESGFSYSNL